jgi:hypothetical protein
MFLKYQISSASKEIIFTGKSRAELSLQIWISIHTLKITKSCIYIYIYAIKHFCCILKDLMKDPETEDALVFGFREKQLVNMAPNFIQKT